MRKAKNNKKDNQIESREKKTISPSYPFTHTLTHAHKHTLIETYTLPNKRTPPMKVMREKTQLLFSSFLCAVRMHKKPHPLSLNYNIVCKTVFSFKASP